MSREEIERGLVEAGRKLDSSFSEQLLIESDSDLAIMAYNLDRETEPPIYELYEVERNISYWVWEIPTSRQAAVLLGEYGGPQEEERGRY